VNIEDIVVKYEYFSRVALNEETIARYKELYELGESLPPLVVPARAPPELQDKVLCRTCYDELKDMFLKGWREVK